MYDIIEKLNVFNNVKYYDEPHEYYINGNKMPLSATKLISNLKKPFDKNYWAKRKADERGITKEEILKEWEYTARVSTEKGTAFHNYVENYLSNRIFPYPESKIKSIDIFDGKDPVKEKFDVLIKMFDSFYKKINGILIPIKSEFVIGDEELQIAGMVDQIFYNKTSKQLEIWDWKTNKEISMSNKWKQKFLAPCSHLDECEFNSYSLQLSIYRVLLEKHTGLEFGNSYLAWFFEGNEEVKYIKVADLRSEAKTLLKITI
jgi:ATP-dependent exoDNAse (exonuclease V) beta subunit